MKNQRKPNRAKKTSRSKPKQQLPAGWDDKRVKDVLDYYENQTEEQQLAEHEAAHHAKGQTVMVVPTDLVPAIRTLIAGRREP